MLSSSEIRDKEFESEIKLLSSQIEHISERYYDNIDFPIRKFNEKIGGDLEKVKKELEDLQNNSIMKNTMNRVEEIMESYMRRID